MHELGRACGPVTFDAGVSRRQLDDEDLFCYLAEDGFLAYSWSGGHSEVQVYNVVAGSAPTARALWSIIASHDSMAGTVRAFVGPDDPVSWLTTEPDVRLTRAYPWMLRVVDAAAAIAGRGFPAAADVAVRLHLADELCPANAGLWSLAVSGGQGTLLRRGAGDAAEPAAPLVLGMRGFAALYAGTPLATLRAAGLAAGGGPASDAALDGAFAATSYLLDYF